MNEFEQDPQYKKIMELSKAKQKALLSEKQTDAAQKATIETAELFRQLNDRLDSEHKARLAAEKSNARFQWANLILVALTLLATIIFGLHSCTIAPTSGSQEPVSVASDSMPAEQS